MSAILGPIHHWLFRKIKIQNDLTNVLIATAKDKGLNVSALADTDEKFGSLPEGDLGNIIDPTNIHGWLQDKIAIVERRLAYVAKNLTEGNADAIGASPVDGFEYYENTFVSGMPCDGVNMIVNEDSDELMWQETVDIHKQYWDEVGANVALFYEIRNAVIEGVFDGSGLTYYSLGNGSYKLVRE